MLQDGIVDLLRVNDSGALFKIRNELDGFHHILEDKLFNNDFHDVQLMTDLSCDSDGNSVELAGNAHGNVDMASAFSNMYAHTITADDAGETLYFGCSYYPQGSYSHCIDGQLLVVTVEKEEDIAAVSPKTKLRSA